MFHKLVVLLCVVCSQMVDDTYAECSMPESTDCFLVSTVCYNIDFRNTAIPVCSFKCFLKFVEK